MTEFKAVTQLNYKMSNVNMLLNSYRDDSLMILNIVGINHANSNL